MAERDEDSDAPEEFTAQQKEGLERGRGAERRFSLGTEDLRQRVCKEEEGFSLDSNNSDNKKNIALATATTATTKTESKGSKEEIDREARKKMRDAVRIYEGIKQDEEMRKIQRENRFRVTREGKERRRQWAQRKTAQPSRGKYVEVSEKELHHNAHHTEGMLPSDIVNILAAREKQTFHSDSDNETMDNKPPPVKRRRKDSGFGPMLLTDIPPAECLNQSREFLKKRKAHVSRSNSALKNSNQALRLLSASGLLIKN